MKRCIVHDCQNHQGEGLFTGDICLPCYNMIVTGNDNPSDNFIHSLHERVRETEILLRTIKQVLAANERVIRDFRLQLLSMNNTFLLYRPETAKSIDDFIERTRGL